MASDRLQVPRQHARASVSDVDDALFDHAYFDATVREIARLQDVEMAEAERQPEIHFVLDTNVLLQHLDVIRQFVDDIEAQNLPLIVVIPRAVLSELDGQKNRKELAWFARRATAWILEKTKERRTVRGQRRDETSEPSSTLRDRDRLNDLSIADCAEYFARRRPGRTFLCSADKNLCNECEFRDVQTVIAPQGEWCSRDVMQAMVPDFAGLALFAAHQRVYRPSAKVRGPRTKAATAQAVNRRETEDSMDIDDDASAEILLPSHALDSLHLQIIEHFKILLQNLALRVGGSALAARGLSGVRSSAHASAFSTKPCHEWTAAAALEYLNIKRTLPRSTPSLDQFMSLPYDTRGARRGQDWPRKAWEEALNALAELGRQWDEGSIIESVSVLPFHCERIFLTPMRPTGM